MIRTVGNRWNLKNSECQYYVAIVDGCIFCTCYLINYIYFGKGLNVSYAELSLS